MKKFAIPILLACFGLISLIAYRQIPACSVDIQTVSYCASVDDAALLLFFTLIISFVSAGVVTGLTVAKGKVTQ